MKPLHHRLNRLENMKAGVTSRCPACGRSPDDEIKIVLGEVEATPRANMPLRSESGSKQEPSGSKYCTRCGALLVMRLQFDNAG
jgi:hypothetical protein